jgi:hypothetical protein
VWRMPEKASLERCDSSAEPALVFRTIKATRLSVANYNTTLSSESLETGTGGSNSLRSANESASCRLFRTDCQESERMGAFGATVCSAPGVGRCKRCCMRKVPQARCQLNGGPPCCTISNTGNPGRTPSCA